jgi:hypothetical protein
MLASNESCGGNTKNKTPVLSALKKVHYLQDTFFVVIDRKIVDELRISQDDDVWVQQSPSDDGILLKLVRNNDVKTN